MPYGPVEYMVISFPGNRFNGEVAPAILDLVQSGTINLLDLAFVHKSAQGEVSVLEAEQEPDEVSLAFRALVPHEGGIISDDDIREIGDGLDPDCSALVAVWEDLWAARFATAVRDSGGVVLSLERIPSVAVEAAVAWQHEPHTA